MAEVPDPVAVKPSEVLVGQEGVPLAAQGLHPGELGGDGDGLELWLQAQVQSGAGHLSEQLAVEQAVCLGVDPLQVEAGNGPVRHRGRSPHHLLRQFGRGKAEGVHALEGDELPLVGKGDMAAFARVGIEHHNALGPVRVIGEAEGVRRACVPDALGHPGMEVVVA